MAKVVNNPAKTNVRELIRTEYMKCAKDPKYFMRKYCYIQHPTKGRILFDLFGYQQTTLDQITKFDYNIILKGRQIGISTVTACYALWLMLFHRDKNILIIATKQETSKNLIIKVKFALSNLPVWLQSPLVENNQLSIRFKNGSQIKAASAALDSGRSEALSLLILDECAHIKNAADIWLSSQATLSTGGKGILISTPNGVGNFFHKIWQESESGTNPFNRIVLDWSVHPERDETWRLNQLELLGERQFRQEYGAEFLGSGHTVIESEIIEEYKSKHVQEPISKTGIDSNIWTWKDVDYSKQYMVVADVARGDGSDFSTFHVIEVEACEQVAEYCGKVDTTIFGNILVEISTKYNDALLVVENANNGWATVQQVINRGYRNLFYMSDDVRVVDHERFHGTNRYYQKEKKQVPGFTTSVRTRPLIISKLDEYMRNRAVILHSIRTLNEMDVFIWENGKAQAQQGYNDDLVMALAIGLWVRDTSMEIFKNNIEMVRNSINAIQRVKSDYAPIMLPGRITADPYSIQTPHGAEDFRWLIQ